MTDEARDAIAVRIADALLEMTQVMRELSAGVRELNARLAVADARGKEPDA